MSDQPRKNSRGRPIARTAWILFLAAFGVNTVVNTVGNVTGLFVLAGPLALALMLVGLCCGIGALFFVSTHGRKGILIPAIIGIVLNGLFILGWVTAISLNNLALLYYNQGQYAEAEPLLKRTLAIYEKVRGPPAPRRGHRPQQPGVALRRPGPVRRGGAALPALSGYR